MFVAKQPIYHFEGQLYMDNCNAAQQQGCIAKQAEQADANRFFDLLSSLELLNVVESQLPELRERNYSANGNLIDVFGTGPEC